MANQAVFILSVILFPLLSFFGNNDKADKTTPFIDDSGSDRPELSLTCVYDNYGVNPELATKWGYACVISMPSEKILFDTGGEPGVLLGNMKKMQVSPASISKVFISHEHLDHLGGLSGFLDENHDVTVYLPTSVPESVRSMITEKGAKYVEITGSQKISDFIYTTGVLRGPPNEQSVVIDSKKGLIVMTGCAHPGIVGIVKKSAELIPGKDIYLVIGGFHRPPGTVVKDFVQLGVQHAAPTHCTGDDIREAFADTYGENFIASGAGKVIEIK